MPAFPLDEAHIVVLFMQSVLHGIYLVTFGMCINAFWSNYNRKRLQIHLVIVALLLFIFATFDVALSLHLVIDSFVWHHGPGGASEEMYNISSWINVMQSVCYVSQTSVADAMLIYRCYIIYGRAWKMTSCLALLWTACSVCDIIICYLEATLHHPGDLDSPPIKSFITAVFAMTLALNVIATSLIVYKLWTTQQLVKSLLPSPEAELHGSSLVRAIRILIESAAVYTISVFVFFVAFLADNYSQYPVSDSVVEISGIAFNLIIIRVERGRSVETLDATRTVTSDYRGGTLTSMLFVQEDGCTTLDRPPSGANTVSHDMPEEGRRAVRSVV